MNFIIQARADNQILRRTMPNSIKKLTMATADQRNLQRDSGREMGQFLSGRAKGQVSHIRLALKLRLGAKGIAHAV